MNQLRTLSLFVLLLAPAAVGCAGRTAPFNEMDQAQVTIMKLQGQEAPQQQAAPGIPGLPAIPGITPEMQAMGQQLLQNAQQAASQILPGVQIPGLPGAQTPAAAPQERFKNFVILAKMPSPDNDTKEELLDIFGHESSFMANPPSKPACFTPGIGITMVRPNQPPVELLISLSCNQAMGDGFKWPYAVNGLTDETRDRLTQVYQKLWGPVPNGGA